jgi:hypothetical protein
MNDFITWEDCLANMNTATIAGKVLEVQALSGKATGFAFTIGYQKHWPNGNTQTIAIRCYITGAERVEKSSWLKPGEWALVHGGVTDKGAVYAHQVEWLSRPARVSDADDAYLAGILASKET